MNKNAGRVTKVPPRPTAYNRALLRARQVTLSNGRLALGRLQTVFQNTADKAAEIIGTAESAYTVARATSMRTQVLEVLAGVEVRARATTLLHRNQTVEDIVKLHRQTVLGIAQKEGATAGLVASTFSQVPARTLAVLAARGANAAHLKTLVNRHMREAADSLDAIIDGGIGTGQSARKMAKDIANLIVGESIRAGDYGLDATDVSGLKSIWYDSRRIAVSEINNAYRESNNQSLQSSGIVDAAQWQLSGRHHLEDECDELAAGSSEGLPEGYYYLDEWPEAPHPFCMCGQGAILFKPVEEWFNGELAESEETELQEQEE